MSEGTPARIDRAALERIIQRAAELQTAERDIGDGLTPDEVLALGREVGIPGRYLQQALLEERTRLVDVGPGGSCERLAGPAAGRRAAGGPGERRSVEAALVHWMEKNELFCVQRQQPGRIAWEPIGGIQAAIRRSTAAFGSWQAAVHARPRRHVSATIVPLEPGYSRGADRRRPGRREPSTWAAARRSPASARSAPR